MHKGKVIQISIADNYKILYKTNAEKQLNGYGGIISIENGKYNPSLELAFIIADFFGKKIEEIFIYERGV